MGTLPSPASTIRGRLAPSPTGLLHLGHARTFLLAWWSARSQGGEVLLRIEDLDGDRAHPDMIAAAEEDLAWLGLDWDGPAVLQSTGLARLQQAIDALNRKGLLYPCVCSRGDIRNAQTAPQLGEAELRYPGTCRDVFASLADAEAQTGRSAALRFRVAEGPITVDDAVVGSVEFHVQRDVGDFVVARRTGAPAYQLAAALDDTHQGVTEVVRGDDLLPSAARQALLQRALDLPSPRFAHVPLVLDEHGKRLAKRDNALTLAELRQGGTDPRAIVTWAARSAGLDVPEPLHPRQVLPLFSWQRVPREPIRLTRATLEELRRP